MCDELQAILLETDGLLDSFLHPKEWMGNLPFQTCRIGKQVDICSSIPLESIDLFDFCKGGKKSNWYGKNTVIRFDPVVYPVLGQPDDAFNMGSVGHKLVTDLLSVCHQVGKSMFCSNGSFNGKHGRRIVCHHFFSFNSTEVSEQKDYNNLALRSNNHGSTLQVPTSRRTVSGRAHSNET